MHVHEVDMGTVLCYDEAIFGKDGFTKMKKLEEYVISIPDFPEPGIIFRDVTSILQDADGLHLAIDQLIAMVPGVKPGALKDVNMEEAEYKAMIEKRRLETTIGKMSSTSELLSRNRNRDE